MSVSQTDAITTLSPRPVGLPGNLQAWRAKISVTGDASAGIASLVAQTRFGNEDIYIGITRCNVQVTTGGAQEANIEAEANDWELGGADTEVLNIVTLKDGNTEASGELVSPDRPFYLGRAEDTGNLKVIFETNTNAAVYTVWMRGVWSREQFVIPKWLTV